MSDDPTDTSRFDDPQLDAPQFDATQFDSPGFETRRFAASRSPSGDESKVMRSSAVVAVGTALSRLTGFVRIAAIAYALGVTALAGTYSYANETPNIVYELLLGGVLTATLVPLFVRHFESHDEDAASAVFTVSILVLVAVTVVGVLLAPWIVDLYTLRVDGANLADQQELATDLLRLFMPQMLFYGIATLATAMLNAKRRFAAAAFAPALNNIVVIAVFLTLPRIADGSLSVDGVLGDEGLLLLMGLGTTAGIVVMALALLPALRRAHVHLRYLPAFRHPAVVTLVRVSGWTVGYVIANQIALFFVTVLANGTSGGPFIYVSAYAFFQLPHGLLAVSLSTTFAPELARVAARGDLTALRGQLSRGLRLTAIVDRARRGVVPRPGAADRRRTPPTRRVLGRRRGRGRRHARRLRRRSPAVLPVPVRACARSRRASTPARRSSSTASRTSSTSSWRSRSTRGWASPGSRSRSRSPTSSESASPCTCCNATSTGSTGRGWRPPSPRR